jgi:hypothetical protein
MYQRTATTITSAGKRNPANADSTGDRAQRRVDSLTELSCRILPFGQRNEALEG